MNAYLVYGGPWATRTEVGNHIWLVFANTRTKAKSLANRDTVWQNDCGEYTRLTAYLLQRNVDRSEGISDDREDDAPFWAIENKAFNKRYKKDWPT